MLFISFCNFLEWLWYRVWLLRTLEFWVFGNHKNVFLHTCSPIRAIESLKHYFGFLDSRWQQEWWCVHDTFPKFRLMHAMHHLLGKVRCDLSNPAHQLFQHGGQPGIQTLTCGPMAAFTRLIQEQGGHLHSKLLEIA